ncbi:MAG: hypothetical protein ACE5FU_05750, partial [Nitrospinota bacterium]
FPSPAIFDAFPRRPFTLWFQMLCWKKRPRAPGTVYYTEFDAPQDIVLKPWHFGPFFIRSSLLSRFQAPYPDFFQKRRLFVKKVCP